MYSKTRKCGIGVLAALLIMSVVPAIAQGGGTGPRGRQMGPWGPGQFGPPGGGGGLAIERMDRELGFTDAQRTAVQELLAAERTALKPTADSLRQAQQAVDVAVMQVPQDDAALQTQVAAVSAIQAQIALARAQTQARIFQLLTPDQQQKVLQRVALMQQRQPRGGRSGQ